MQGVAVEMKWERREQWGRNERGVAVNACFSAFKERADGAPTLRSRTRPLDARLTEASPVSAVQIQWTLPHGERVEKATSSFHGRNGHLCSLLLSVTCPPVKLLGVVVFTAHWRPKKRNKRCSAMASDLNASMRYKVGYCCGSQIGGRGSSRAPPPLLVGSWWHEDSDASKEETLRCFLMFLQEHFFSPRTLEAVKHK